MCDCRGYKTNSCWYQASWWLLSMFCLLALANRSTAAQSLSPQQTTITVLVAWGQQAATEPAPGQAASPSGESESGESESGEAEPEKAESGETKGAAGSDEATNGNLAKIAAPSDTQTVAEIDLTVSADTVSADDLQGVLQTTSPLADSQADSQKPHPLSVEPSSQMLPKDRPSWIDSDPDMESETHRFVVASIPTSLKSELGSNLEATLVAALKTYVNQQFGTDTDQLIHDRLTAAFIQTNLVDENKSYVAEMQTGEGPLFQKWVMVEVTPEQRHQLQLWVSQQIQQQRILPLGLLLSGLLTAIGLSHMLLRRRTSVPDSLKATQVQLDKRAIDAGRSQQPKQAAKNARCCSSGQRGFGLFAVLFVALVILWMVASPASSSNRKKHIRPKQEVELRFQTEHEKQADNCQTLVI